MLNYFGRIDILLAAKVNSKTASFLKICNLFLHKVTKPSDDTPLSYLFFQCLIEINCSLNCPSNTKVNLNIFTK